MTREWMRFTKPTRKPEGLLGERARWGRIGYTGRAFAPAAGTYAGLDPSCLAYASVEDSGPFPTQGRDLANLHPLVAAALYEVAFANEAGPLVTWNN